MQSLKYYAKNPRLTTLAVELTGVDLIRHPLLNKGTAFTREERREFGLEGLLPYQYNTMEQQVARAYAAFCAAGTPLEQYINLATLQERNEHLFYKLLKEHLEELMPIVYTPTVGLATRRFSHYFRRTHGLWITPDMRGRIRSVLARIAADRDVKLLVVTDNESILGIGDQGCGGFAIAVGKLALYCAGAGIHPALTLPISLDVGTDNASLLEDALYRGWPHPRLRGDEYYTLVDEFVAAVTDVFPGALIQWEDFRKDNALRILDRYSDRVPSFNDDIQGTGAVAAAGVRSALRATGATAAGQRVVIHGAGAAGLGIARQLRVMFAALGMPDHELRIAVAVLDSRGLLVGEKDFHEIYKRELAWPSEEAARLGLDDSARHGLADVVAALKPTVLIGTSGQAGAFTREVVTEMARHVERPLIMPFSNPTEQSEATPRNLLEWTEGRAMVATGSPFADVELDGRLVRVGQGNNVFVFPGLGLGTLVAGARRVTDGMLAAAVDALSSAVSDAELKEGLLYPAMSRLREISLRVAAAVQARAVDEGLCAPCSPEEQQARLDASVWDPDYREYRYRSGAG
jgi:malate dehydrogenase (oxaloacetate-decarboxylating)